MGIATQVLSRYITHDPNILQGEPIIVGTKTPVRAIIETWRLAVQPEEIPQHLPHLSLAQVFDALSYYQDHMAEINHYIARNRVLKEQIHPLIREAFPEPE
jgi:uncharacterized protein (DUF433 family)